MERRRDRLRPGGHAAGPAAYLERRRADALALQRAAREQATARARAALAASAACSCGGGAADQSEDHTTRSHHRGSGTTAATAAYASALTSPEWMVDVPTGLAAEW